MKKVLKDHEWSDEHISTVGANRSVVILKVQKPDNCDSKTVGFALRDGDTLALAKYFDLIPRWKSISEEPPEEFEEVLLKLQSGKVGVGYIFYCADGKPRMGFNGTAADIEFHWSKLDMTPVEWMDIPK